MVLSKSNPPPGCPKTGIFFRFINVFSLLRFTFIIERKTETPAVQSIRTAGVKTQAAGTSRFRLKAAGSPQILTD